MPDTPAQAPQPHPDMALESAHLADTLAVITQERALSAQELGGQAANVTRLHAEAGGLLSLDEEIAKQLLRYMEQHAHHLQLASGRPYFTRVDFTPTGGAPERHYIGKWGILRSADLSSVVVDWRSPVANLYYSGQIGPVHYVTPDGEVRGELTLKRNLAIEDGRLLSIFDIDVVSQDAYLQQALSAVSPAKLREIVSTIQAEQNFVIRHAPVRPLVVQGVAGSGKTTIALHRIAWLLYAYQDKLAPEQMIILAPNPMFLDYISAVLPDLGVEMVRQSTFTALMQQVLDKDAPRLLPDDTLDRVLAQTPEERARTTARLRLMGSLAFRQAVRAFAEALERRVVPEGDVAFGPVRLFTHDELQHIFTQELGMFPLRRRVQELRKYYKRRLKDALAQVEAWLRRSCDQRVEALAAQLPDSPLRRQRMGKLYDSRDLRIAEARKEAASFVQHALARYPRLDLHEAYAAFWQEPPETLDAAQRQAWAHAAQDALATLAQKRAHTEDLPALCVLHRTIAGWARQDIRHVVIDEAQDLSPFQIALLQEMAGNQSFTIVGDLMQGVHAYRGLTDWAEIIDGVFGGEATYHQLVTSYRNTVEIMAFAARMARRHPVAGQVTPQPVLRHGPAPALCGFPTRAARNAALLQQVEAWRAEGFRSIAVIGHDEAECRALHKALPPTLDAHLIQPEQTAFPSGLMIIPASMVKGLEFDAVLVADVCAERWADNALEARLLYVCFTRPLHRLTCFSIGAWSALLEGMHADSTPA